MDRTVYKATVTDAFNRSAATYDDLGVDFFTPMGRRLASLAAIKPGHRVLDVGCGRGATLFPTAAIVGATGHITGIDIAPAMIEETQKEVDRKGLRTISLRVMDGEHPRFPAASFNAVLGSFSIIFLPDAPGALRRYAQLLAPRGVIGFTSPVFTDDTFPFLPPVFTPMIPRSVLDSLPPEHQPERLRKKYNSWLTRAEDVTATLEAAGFEGVTVHDEPVDMVAASAAAWVEWSHTQGMRLLWECLDPPQRKTLRERLLVGLDALSGKDGRLVIETPVRYVTATVAG